MNKYKVLFGPVISPRNICTATLIGDSKQVKVGKKLIDENGNALIIMNIGTQCGIFQPDRTNVLLNGKINKAIINYTLID